jgi:uncharacterized protein (TIGR03083 family)
MTAMADPTTVDVTDVGPLTHDEAMDLLAIELERTLDLLRSLDAAEWEAQTDCPARDVRRMELHVLGACEAAASTKEMVHQMREARRHRRAHGGPLEAALSAVQVRERDDLTPAELVERLAAVAPTTVRKRTRLPALVRHRATMQVDGPVVERWTLGYLVDTIYLRDLWMHRVDATRVTGRPMVMTPDHDGRIVADVVAEWARRHGQACTLSLTGPAGGTFAGRGSGDDQPRAASTPTVELDAVEFCRTLAGRTEGVGLLTTLVPF